MREKINIRHDTKETASKFLAALIQAKNTASKWARKKIAAIRGNKRAAWLFGYAEKWVLVILVIAVYTVVIFRVAYNKAIEGCNDRMGRFGAERILISEKDGETAQADQYEAQLDAEAEMLAKVLYGVKDNDNDDLRTYCWCVFNRVENKAFPDTLEDVIAQPKQWMRYDPTNPIIESLYQLAREQLDAWHSNSHRPVSNDFVFMKWSKDDICLRDNFYEGSGCHYWRYGQ